MQREDNERMQQPIQSAGKLASSLAPAPQRLDGDVQEIDMYVNALKLMI
jgi:hypothetical protein